MLFGISGANIITFAIISEPLKLTSALLVWENSLLLLMKQSRNILRTFGTE